MLNCYWSFKFIFGRGISALLVTGQKIELFINADLSDASSIEMIYPTISEGYEYLL